MTFPIKPLQWNLHKAAILESRHLNKTDSLICLGLILKQSLTVQPLQNGHSITWTLFPVSRERTIHLIHLFATAACSYRIEVIFFFIQSMAFS